MRVLRSRRHQSAHDKPRRAYRDPGQSKAGHVLAPSLKSCMAFQPPLTRLARLADGGDQRVFSPAASCILGCCCVDVARTRILLQSAGKTTKEGRVGAKSQSATLSPFWDFRNSEPEMPPGGRCSDFAEPMKCKSTGVRLRAKTKKAQLCGRRGRRTAGGGLQTLPVSLLSSKSISALEHFDLDPSAHYSAVIISLQVATQPLPPVSWTHLPLATRPPRARIRQTLPPAVSLPNPPSMKAGCRPCPGFGARWTAPRPSSPPRMPRSPRNSGSRS